jgi:serine/threonine protein kinase
VLKKPIRFETTFGTYDAKVILGEGGAGIVYGGIDPEGVDIAIKVLASDRASGDKRRRFKNEIGFLSRVKHKNIVNILDHGVYKSEKSGALQPFYVMPRYSGSLRDLISGGINHKTAFDYFIHLLDGVEAAHLNGVVHRDLKPENALYDEKTQNLSVADFGVADFTDDLLLTLVETKANQRLANFQYAAPEQRVKGGNVAVPADIYALGLMLNELFTRSVPHGTEFCRIESVAPEYAYLDKIIDAMLRQNPSERPSSIAVIKGLIQKHKAEAVALQKISKITNTVVTEGTIDDPLAYEPPQLVAAKWNDNQLILTLDRPVSNAWVGALHNMGNYTSVMGMGPETFRFSGNMVTVSCQEHSAQNAIDHFKQWLPRATQVLKYQLEQEEKRKHNERLEQLRREKEAEERHLRVNSSLKI